MSRILLLAVLGACAGPREKSLNFGEGVFPEVEFWNGDLWLVYQNGPTMRLLNLDRNQERDIPLKPGSLAFPRMEVKDASLYLVYRDGDTALLSNVSTGATETLGRAFGNDPVAIDHAWVAWQADPERIIKRRLIKGGAVEDAGNVRPTGLSRILADGSVTLVDDDRRIITGYTRPCFAGDMTVAERGRTGVVVKRPPAPDRILWPGVFSFTPRCAQSGPRSAVATWGPNKAGVRVAEFGD